MKKQTLSHIGQIGITVSDVEKVLPFYKDSLGLDFLFMAGPNLAFLQSGDTRIMLTTPQGGGAEIGKNSILYFKTADIESTYQSILDNGGTAERGPELAAKMPDHELWLAFIRDPDGNLVGLMQEKPIDE